ncbi:hypothetical protein M2401_000832 [Pseudomonas sp. JUb42]|uniref:hypothetical protein n=1 Tax=Pseudomonas sp. JUb42 TaxID=2940611 RepID=UPI002168B490|nr:hypothetical protein [Pseudomonas sp. JUb42]MCS3467111.1 hypothetical protein [Pseudomonas sp. JUb42]
MKDNLTVLTGPIDKQRAELEALKRSMPMHIEFLAIQAQMIRAKYQALVAQGFTEAQALELCK